MPLMPCTTPSPRTRRRLALACLAAASACLAPLPAAAQDWPANPQLVAMAMASGVDGAQHRLLANFTKRYAVAD